jgi:hypothetical protein
MLEIDVSRGEKVILPVENCTEEAHPQITQIHKLG